MAEYRVFKKVCNFLDFCLWLYICVSIIILIVLSSIFYFSILLACLTVFAYPCCKEIGLFGTFYLIFGLPVGIYVWRVLYKWERGG